MNTEVFSLRTFWVSLWRAVVAFLQVLAQLMPWRPDARTHMDMAAVARDRGASDRRMPQFSAFLSRAKGHARYHGSAGFTFGSFAHLQPC